MDTWVKNIKLLSWNIFQLWMFSSIIMQLLAWSRCLYWSTVNKMTPTISTWSLFTLQVILLLLYSSQSYFILKSIASCYNSLHSVTVPLHSRNWVQTHWKLSAELYLESLVNIKTQKQSKKNATEILTNFKNNIPFVLPESSVTRILLLVYSIIISKHYFSNRNEHFLTKKQANLWT